MISVIQKKEFKKKRLYIMAFILPAVILLLSMWIKDVFPMGENSVLLWDLEIQYIDLFAWFRNALHSGEGIFYSLSKSLGGNMFGLYSLYLTSPLNLLIYFFEIEDIPAFFSLMTILKLSLAGLTMCIFIKKRFQLKNNVIILIASSAYALMEYDIAFCSNIHFLDSIYMLPLVALGVWQLVNQRKKALLYFSILYVIVCNWYIGYMVCLFSVFDFIFEYFLCDEVKEKRIQRMIHCGVQYTVTMILSVLSSCVFFLPAVLAAMNGKGTLSLKKLLPDFHVDPLYPLRALFIATPTNTEHGLPAIYVSYVLLLLCIAFLVNRNIQVRLRKAVFVFLFFVFISFSFVPLEIIWTDFKETYSFHHRYAFVFCFLMILAACFYIRELEKNRAVFSFKQIIVCGCAVCCFFVVQDLVKDLGSVKQVGCSVILTLLYAVLVGEYYSFQHCTIRKSRVCIWMIFILFIGEQVYNVSDTFSRYCITLEEYRKYAQEMDKAIDQIDDREEDIFYRVEKTFSEMSDRRNDREPAASEGFVYQYRGITHYSSTYDTIVNEFLTNLGYCDRDAMAVNYVESNFLADSLLGIRYVISENEPCGMKKISDYTDEDSKAVYLNEYALKFGTISKGDTDQTLSDQNPFQNIQNLINGLLNEENIYFSPLKAELSDDAEVSWNIEVEENGPVYAYFGSEHSEADIYVNGEYKQPYFSRFYKNIMYLGDYEVGEVINLKLKDVTDKNFDYQLYVVGCDESLAKEKLLKLKKDSFDPDEIKGGVIKGNYYASEQVSMVLQIPYDEGWTVYINGEKVSYKKAYDSLIELEIPKGENVIIMKYCPPGLKLGLICTVLGIILFIVWTIFSKIQRKNTI